MIIDPVCSIVFEAEDDEADTMRRPPRPPSAPLFTAGFAAWSVFQGALVLALVAGLFVMALRQNRRSRMRDLWPLQRWSPPILA